MLDQVKRLKDQTEASLPGVFGALEDMVAESQPLSRRSDALGRALAELAAMLNIEIFSDQFLCHTRVISKTWLLRGSDIQNALMKDRFGSQSSFLRMTFH